MENKNGNKFIWGNYDYSNDLSKDINPNIEKTESNQEKEKTNFFSPIKSKIKIAELSNQIKDKLTFDNKNETSKLKQNDFSFNINFDENIYEDEEDFQIKCNIDEYKDRVIGKDHVIFYKIELNSSVFILTSIN